MFLVSVYFDDETEKRLSALMKRVAKLTGNNFMEDNQVPPHITVAAVEMRGEDKLIERIIFSPYYKPFSWLPHCTIAKQLSTEQVMQAFSELLKHFTPINGYVARIGIAKTNPHRDIKVWELQ